MEEFLLEQEPVIYGVFYFGAMAVVAFCESLFPRRELMSSIRARWLANFALVAFDNLVLRWLFPMLGLAFVSLVAEKGWGLLAKSNVPYGFAFVGSVLLLDFGNYVQHVLLHHVPVLWRFHRIHHSDSDYDFTTGFRFHPVEAVFTAAFNLAAIAIAGVPLIAFVIYEVIHVIQVMASHANVRLPTTMDHVLRFFVVTPDTHRVHHSAITTETNSNFGSILPWWDWIFGTYTAQPTLGHQAMTIGLADVPDPRHLNLGWILTEPFRLKNRAA